MEKISQIQTPFIQNQSIAKPQTENKTEGFSEIFKNQLEEVNKLQNT